MGTFSIEKALSENAVEHCKMRMEESKGSLLQEDKKRFDKFISGNEETEVDISALHEKLLQPDKSPEELEKLAEIMMLCAKLTGDLFLFSLGILHHILSLMRNSDPSENPVEISDAFIGNLLKSEVYKNSIGINGQYEDNFTLSLLAAYLARCQAAQASESEKPAAVQA